jgi:DNA-binding CsgD family transcriptional regulator
MPLGRALAAGVMSIAVLNTLSAVSMPLRDRKPALPVVLIWLALLSLHAAAYRFGDRIRARFDLRVYAGVQAAILFAVAVSRPPGPVTIVLFMAGVAELVGLAGSRWGTIRITLIAIAVLILAALLTSDLYRAATAGLILAVTGLMAHAVAGLLERRATVALEAGSNAATLSARETEVLRELVSGARNTAIAEKLGISERTVKAHLGSIYQKLGVDSRSAAVAAAMRRKLV